MRDGVTLVGKCQLYALTTKAAATGAFDIENRGRGRY